MAGSWVTNNVFTQELCAPVHRLWACGWGKTSGFLGVAHTEAPFSFSPQLQGAGWADSGAASRLAGGCFAHNTRDAAQGECHIQTQGGAYPLTACTQGRCRPAHSCTLRLARASICILGCNSEHSSTLAPQEWADLGQLAAEVVQLYDDGELTEEGVMQRMCNPIM